MAKEPENPRGGASGFSPERAPKDSLLRQAGSEPGALLPEGSPRSGSEGAVLICGHRAPGDPGRTAGRRPLSRQGWVLPGPTPGPPPTCRFFKELVLDHLQTGCGRDCHLPTRPLSSSAWCPARLSFQPPLQVAKADPTPCNWRLPTSVCGPEAIPCAVSTIPSDKCCLGILT